MPPRKPDQDQELLRRARDGDYRSFEELVKRHEQRLFGLAMRILRQREDAENVVQTTFLSALEHLKDFREDSSFGTWVARIATHASLNTLRKRKGLRTVSISEGDDETGEIHHPQLVAHWRDDPASIVEARELGDILTDAINTLSEKHRLVFVLRDVEGLSVSETAELLDISEPNVKVRLLRARLALRERLTQVFGDGSEPLARPHSHGGDEEGSTPAKRLLENYEKHG